MNCQNLPVRPQKGLFLRMSCQNLPICPQKGPILRMSCQNLPVCPQKGPVLRMSCQNLTVCSFLILVDYLKVLSLGKVDSVYKLKLIIVDFSVLYLSLVYLPSLIPVRQLFGRIGLWRLWNELCYV